MGCHELHALGDARIDANGAQILKSECKVDLTEARADHKPPKSLVSSKGPNKSQDSLVLILEGQFSDEEVQDVLSG